MNNNIFKLIDIKSEQADLLLNCIENILKANVYFDGTHHWLKAKDVKEIVEETLEKFELLTEKAENLVKKTGKKHESRKDT